MWWELARSCITPSWADGEAACTHALPLCSPRGNAASHTVQAPQGHTVQAPPRKRPGLKVALYSEPNLPLQGRAAGAVPRAPPPEDLPWV